MSDFFNHHFNAGARVEAQAGAVGQALEDQGLLQGQMLSASKSYYSEQHPDHTVFFNGCIFVKERKPFWQWILFRRSLFEKRSYYQQVWWGDIDLTEEWAEVAEASDACGQDLWVTRERYRFDGYHGEKNDGVVFFKARK